MPVRLMVTKGASAGKTFEIKVPQFVIGRSSSCQLRPQSDAISRQHCVVLLTKDGGAAIRDLGSRNGTIVNGKTTKGTQVLQTGDEVRVGPLHLEVTILDATGQIVAPGQVAKKAAEKPATARVDQPSAKTVAAPKSKSGKKASDSGLISDWLTEDVDANPDASLSRVETRQFKLDETERIVIKKAAEEVAEATPKKKDKKKKKEPGKLPEQKKEKLENSQQAAEETLRKMFNRGL